MTSPRPAPLSYEVDVRTLPAKGLPVRLAANADERDALARACGLIRVDAFEADLDVTRWRAEGVAVEGALKATVVQSCVLTLDDIVQSVETRVAATFVPEQSALAARIGHEIAVDPEGDDPPETFAGATIDVGVLATEFFMLALDPYPRAPEAELPDAATDTDAANPFAALAALRDGGAEPR